MGHVDDFQRYVEDLRRFDTQMFLAGHHRRRFLLAHSMGGCVASLYLQQEGAGSFHAAALSAPMFAPKILTPRIREMICAAMGMAGTVAGCRYVPGSGRYDDYPPRFRENALTHSPVRFRRMAAVFETRPELKVGGPSVRWVSEACRASRTARAGARLLQLPVLLLQAGEDALVCPGAQAEFVAGMNREGSSGQCRACTVAGARHELLMERDEFRLPVMYLILGFFDSIRPGGTVGDRPDLSR
jgi:lysophospholipase